MPRLIDRIRQDGADRLKALTPLSLRVKLVRGRLRVRIWTGPLRTTPDLLIVGGQRCGTSSLYKWLGRHPNVAPSLRKEIEYFSIDYARGERWYRAHFPLTIRRAVAGWLKRPFVTFEATPDYLFDPRAPQRAHDLVPGARIIILLREPGDRAISHYHHNERLGHEPLDLETALRSEKERVAGEMERTLAEPGYRAIGLRRFSYVGRGRYAEQIERWTQLYPSEQVLILKSEDLFGDTAATFARILEFLDLPGWQPPEFRNYSYINSLAGSYKAPEPAIAGFLAGELGPANTALVEMLGEEFSWPTPAAS